MYQPLPQPSVPLPSFDTTPLVVFPQHQQPAQIVPGQGGTELPCRGGPLCLEVGLNILQQMKAIPGRPGWL
ncbi:unnamed protein product, partial [Rotaria magnacalcarata]